MLYVRKLSRELLAQRGQVLALLCVIALGVMLFVCSAGAYLDLRDSYADTRAQLALADLHIDVPQVSQAQVERLRAMRGIRLAAARVVAAVPVVITRHAVVVRPQLRVLSLPDTGQEPLDHVLVLSGHRPAGAEVLLEKHFAEHHHLVAGNTLQIGAGGSAVSLRVSGVAVTAEYLWVARDEQDLFPSPDAFGVGWMERSALRDVALHVRSDAGGAAPGLAGIDVAASDAAGSQLLVTPTADRATALRAVRDVLGEDQLLRVVRADQLVGVRLLESDVDGYKGIAAFFPMLFLGVACFILASLLARVVEAQRAVVGTFLALGVGRSRILQHYLQYALAIGASGGILGAMLGIACTPSLTYEYARDLGIPFVSTHVHAALALAGVGMALATSALAGLIPAARASRLTPAEAMRPRKPATSPLLRLARFERGPLALRMAVRDLLGRPTRTIGTAAGIAAALVLVLTTGATMDSMRTMLSVVFHDSQRYDFRVDFVQPEPLEVARAQMRGVAGVADMEGVLELPAVLETIRHREEALLVGLAPRERLVRSMDFDQRMVRPGTGGIVLTRALASALGAHVGDPVRVTVPATGHTTELRITGLADGAFGNTARAERAELQLRLGLGQRVTSVAIVAQTGERDRVANTISGMSNVGHVEDLASTRSQIEQLMALGWAMLFVMLACAGVLAAAILFNTATLGILERRRELATLRALGRSAREIAFGITLEHGLVCMLGFAIGWPLAIAAIRKVLALYSSDLFRWPFVLTRTTVAVACVGITAVLAVAQWPALRRIARDSLADAVRTHEG